MENSKSDAWGSAQKKDKASEEGKNAAPNGWDGFRAHFERDRSKAVERREENSQPLGNHEVSSAGIRWRARS
jgi:hypothetical protein